MNQLPPYTDAMGSVELVPGTLRGYRGWRWDHCCDKLSSTGVPYVWEQERLQHDARCIQSTTGIYPLHSSPARRCGCGYYASYAPRDYEYQAGIYGPGYIHGTVSAHGYIVLGTGGFRAQRVQVDAFYGPGGGSHAALIYKVPWFKTVYEMVSEFPPSNVNELLGQNAPAPRRPPLYDEFMNPVEP